MRRVWCVLMVVGLMAAASCAVPQSSTKSSRRAGRIQAIGKPPIWAVAMDWPFHSGLTIQYNAKLHTAPMCGAYTRASGFASPVVGKHWRTYTWKLTDVDFAGRQNGGADLRLACPPGIAVHAVTLSMRPPATISTNQNKAGGLADSLVFDTGRAGATVITTGHNMGQVWAGGNTGDSKYTCGTVAGKGAEIFARHLSAGYIYLRLDRRSPLFLAHPPVVYATVTYLDNTPATVWPEQTFEAFAAHGVDYAELEMNWTAMEPRPGQFNFTFLDQMLANAAKAHIRIIPVFWYYQGGNGTPAWITRFEVGSSGVVSSTPAWWNHFNRRSYFRYVTATIAHIKHNPAFGGAFLSYGWVDSMWFGWKANTPGNINGYARADVARFHLWLPSRYHSLNAFNRRYHTHFTSWDAIPAAKPGQPRFRVYQHFRNWSVIETYRRLTELVRRETTAPLYYYWGGGFFNAGVAFNFPDTFFNLARRYRVTVCEDCADRTGMMLLFGSLARAYRVPLFEEWAPGAGLHAEIAKFLGHYGFEMPWNAGMDFFRYDGGREYKIGYGQYVRWLPVLSQIHGTCPEQPVAVYISYRRAFTNPVGLAGMSSRLAEIWRRLHIAFTVVTDREVNAGVIGLRQFRAVLPLNGRHDPAIAAYAKRGGHVLNHAAQLASYAPAYITFTPTDDCVEAVPIVNRSAHTAWITLSGWRPGHSYSGVATVKLKALGLPRGRYDIVSAATGKSVSSVARSNALRVPLHIAPGELTVWRISPGPRK